jgi:hypothetical protein
VVVIGNAEGSEWLGVRDILREALAVGRGHFWGVVLPAVVIFVPLTTLDTCAEYLAEDSTSGSRGAVIEAVSVAGTSGLLFGWVLYVGLLDSLVGSHYFGRPHRPLGRRLRELPYARLIAADIVVSVLVLIGVGLLVVPGLVVLALLGITGSVIVVERRGVVDALIRSARLVKPHFVTALSLIALPFLAEQTIEDLMLTVWPSSLWAGVLVSIGLTLVVAVTVSLIEVVLAHELIARDRVRRAPDRSR